MKIKMTSFFGERVKKNLKNRIALIALASVMTFNLVGCGQGYVEGQNKQSFEYTQEDTSVYAAQTPFSDEDLRNLPSSIESIHLDYALYLSDLDGTLLYTLEDLKDSVNYALEKQGFPLRELSEIRNFVGNGIRLLMERAVPENIDAETFEICFKFFNLF